MTALSAEDLVRRAIEGVRVAEVKGSRRSPPIALWLRVKALFGYGSTTSWEICRAHEARLRARRCYYIDGVAVSKVVYDAAED